ncbi:MAG TPA: GNAT family N-acetyltransferase [Ramlibacter sp.]|nr:GNAT family N-acetyltransferase [Ramlibacter sp.]
MEHDVHRLQRFFDASPGYFHIVSGASAPSTEAREEFDSLPPPDWPQGRKWMLGFDSGDELAGMATLIADLFATGVWHVGLFMVAESRFGQGGPLYRDMEAWMQARGARWLRLGVVAGNDRAERFWRREGYVEVRRREGFKVGAQVNQLIVMAKPLAGETLAEYAALVARDRPESP